MCAGARVPACTAVVVCDRSVERGVESRISFYFFARGGTPWAVQSTK